MDSASCSGLEFRPLQEPIRLQEYVEFRPLTSWKKKINELIQAFGLTEVNETDF